MAASDILLDMKVSRESAILFGMSQMLEAQEKKALNIAERIANKGVSEEAAMLKAVKE